MLGKGSRSKVRNYGGNVGNSGSEDAVGKKIVQRVLPSSRLTLRMKTLRFPKSIPNMWLVQKPNLAIQRKKSLSRKKYLNG